MGFIDDLENPPYKIKLSLYNTKDANAFAEGNGGREIITRSQVRFD